MRGRFLALLFVSISFDLAACVGDDPTPGGTSQTDAGAAEGGTPPGTPPPPPPPGPPSAPPAGDGGDGGAWTPAVLDSANQLALWLDAESSNVVLSTGHIGVWKDLSKNHNDAANAGGGPSADSTALGGHGAVHFTQWAVSLAIPDNASLHFGLDQFYAAAVVKASPSASGIGFIFSKATYSTGTIKAYKSGFELYTMLGANPDSGTPFDFPAAHLDSDTSIEPQGLEWGDDVFGDGKFHLVTFRRIDAASMALSVDQVATKTAQSTAVTADNTVPALIGSVVYGESFTPPIDFEIGELVIVHGSTGVVGDADANHVRDYLKSKYGL